ncbi:YbaK family protein [Desertibacillus haloalkaliphilus]|uniref:YbaK family protein n=1 Tax=Desertibacillus haloalkaliphilus TaxID=1328930 RepID=UPI001C27AD6D|nr:YbaK family protein [Desertibacillus haloalkaliphilus]MBU8908578.1 YbaK family protein [Desertibacillus haloalkaliphilus]
MTVITTFAEKQRKKRWLFERKVLRELSLKEISEGVKEHFKYLFPTQYLRHPFLEDPCIDIAIDAYLLGAEFSRFGYYGETMNQVRKRCFPDIHELISSLFELLQGWTYQADFVADSLFVAVETYVYHWWEKGFSEGEKRYRLRLH